MRFLPVCMLLLRRLTVCVHSRKGAFGSPCSKSTNLIHERFILISYLLPKAPPPNTITLDVKFSSYEFSRNINIQSTAYCRSKTSVSQALKSTAILKASVKMADFSFGYRIHRLSFLEIILITLNHTEDSRKPKN